MVIEESQSRYFDARGAKNTLEMCVDSLEKAGKLARYSSDSRLEGCNQ